VAITETSRHRLHTTLEDVLGEEQAATLMEHLPPTGWADVATKSDLDQLRVATKSDLDQLRVATKSDLDQLRVATKSDLDQLRVATNSDLDHLREVMDLRFAQADTRMDQMVTKGEFHRTLRMHTLALIGTNLVLWGTLAGKAL
jgi:hypothetical protein